MTISIPKKSGITATNIAITITLLLTLLFISIIQAEESMLTKKPYFTYRLDTKGALYQTTINGVLLDEDFEGHALNFEQPVNQYMRTGKNRIGIQLYTFTPGEFGEANITISLFVNQDGASEKDKKLISQVTFKGQDFAVEKNAQQAINTSMPAVKLNSNKEFISDEEGDVTVYGPKIVKSEIEPTAFYIYQDIDLVTPFPLWGFFSADELDFPTLWSDFTQNVSEYDKSLITPLYQEHEYILGILNTQDFDKILPLFEERNREYDIALYYPEGTYEEMLKKSLQDDFDDNESTLKLQTNEYAQPAISDDKKLIRLGASAMIRFVNEEDGIYSKYPIWFYKKDGKWIISR